MEGLLSLEGRPLPAPAHLVDLSKRSGASPEDDRSGWTEPETTDRRPFTAAPVREHELVPDALGEDRWPSLPPEPDPETAGPAPGQDAAHLQRLAREQMGW
ncbi:hypothetical protein [Ectothiorhodospira lacustris]|uniref:hypothetical protein n=1 Tax=Ectothiorhodospira lacustris TaxID=2899127 RepID=UPI001EE7F56D|nr:hypothetical protein [Ectothiorhodospira lacustris]MCG5501140.1 hypothetical protein [Ectothiorhodospira lacustris]MCG5511218.1 hypothetical protein [Ectothiorhodospira lacustris]MCG5522966.1 hypothetical protein [Ectothiorhodospira lacustris]